MKYFVLIALAISFASCGTKASSDDTRADLIPSPISGYKCFVIRSNGTAVGGNCVKD